MASTGQDGGPPSLHISPPGTAYASASASSTGGVAPPPVKRPPHGRARSSSLVSVTRVEETHEEMIDQSTGFNANADWVNYKGAWVIHVVLILLAKILLDVIPAMQQDTSWTLVNLGYMALSYIMFHYVTGTPFESNAGVYDQLTLWEQIDEGAQYTPAKKWLTSVPIGLFLISTHYTRYNPLLFGLNFSALLFVLFPKLPILHRLRFRFFEAPPTPSPHPSQPPTPTSSRAPSQVF
ncbi:probable ORM1 - unfolded protein response protein [Ustilago trichophora]|uniref:Probable ORM1 - unfolded protein response protein n=1 Tax=Ustilago trichophora TaxID=86804 RepID=A0A5C3E0F5_9BASI|nr:probable ORM1 - unfolded protein response protein [Ustilago trichophora]